MRNYVSTTIELMYKDEASLSIFLHKDGTINRKGDGSIVIDNNLFMGIQDGLFDQLIQTVDAELEQYLGIGTEFNDKEGEVCTLEITLSDEAITYTTQFIYGSVSLGLPRAINRYIRNAVQLTDSWYYEQRKRIDDQYLSFG